MRNGGLNLGKFKSIAVPRIAVCNQGDMHRPYAARQQQIEGNGTTVPLRPMEGQDQFGLDYCTGQLSAVRGDQKMRRRALA